jgi:hypothetical protein
MKINEVTNIHRTYLATVRIVVRDSSVTARTTIKADTLKQARAMLTRTYGDRNVLSIMQVMSEQHDMTEATKTLSPQELQVKSLSDKAKQYREQAKAMKARQQMAKAQQDLIRASQSSPQLLS